MNPEMLKLIMILGIGLPIGIIGQYIIIKRKNAKKAKQAAMYKQEYNQSETSAQEGSKEEETARNYIEQYKSQYPKESIKQGLLNYGISDNDAEKYIKKYF